MGLAEVAIKMTNFFTVMVSLFAMLGRLKAIAAKSLPGLGLGLGLHDSEEEEELGQAPPVTVYTILVTNGQTPFLRNIPIHTLTSVIKEQLAVLEYGTYVEKKIGGGEGDEVAAATCSVCLSAIERSDEVRELCNCSHVFHKKCLDRWVDENQVTCPLCRALLFPVNWDAGHRTNCYPKKCTW